MDVRIDETGQECSPLAVDDVAGSGRFVCIRETRDQSVRDPHVAMLDDLFSIEDANVTNHEWP